MQDVSKCISLEELWEYTHHLNTSVFGDNGLMPIASGGKCTNPDVMFVFINPTKRNVSSSPTWKGQRAPFIGTKNVWRVFFKAGMFDGALLEKINKLKDWDKSFADEVYRYLTSHSFYFTNIVKRTEVDATLPKSQKIKTFLPILEKEIALVKPKYIVAFGQIPFTYLTDVKIRFADYYDEIMRDNELKFYEKEFYGFSAKILPCYFPVGLGNPKRACEILRLVKELL